MQWYRIWTMVIRYALILKHVWARRLLIIYFPALDIIVYGLMGSWFTQLHTSLQQEIVLWYLTARVLWNALASIHLELSGDIQTEIGSFNVTNLFASPLELSEWLTAITILGILRGIFSVVYGAALSWLFFSINLFSLGWILIPFTFVLMCAGIALGILISAFFLRWGMQMHVVRWTLPASILVISATFFPLDFFPPWVQYIAQLLPTTYIFQAIRQATMLNIYDWNSVLIASLLAVVYLIGAIALFFYYFKCSKEKGLVQLEQI